MAHHFEHMSVCLDSIHRIGVIGLSLYGTEKEKESQGKENVAG